MRPAPRIDCSAASCVHGRYPMRGYPTLQTLLRDGCAVDDTVGLRSAIAGVVRAQSPNPRRVSLPPRGRTQGSRTPLRTPYIRSGPVRGARKTDSEARKTRDLPDCSWPSRAPAPAAAAAARAVAKVHGRFDCGSRAGGGPVRTAVRGREAGARRERRHAAPRGGGGGRAMRRL